MKVSMGTLLTLVLVLSASAPLISPLSPHAASPAARPVSNGSPAATTFSLDGVRVEVSTAFLADLQFATSDPDAAIQTATAVQREPLFKELSITVIPFGSTPPTESLPMAESGAVDAYRAGLRRHREAQGGDPRDGPAIRLFEKNVVGLHSEVDVDMRGESPTRVFIAEWVVEAGDRIWLVRASQDLDKCLAQPRVASLADSLSDLELRSADLEQPSTSLAAAEQGLSSTILGPQGSSAESADAPQLPFPSWWSGECDADNFYAATRAQAYPLGAEHRGMKACGPRPWADGGPWTYVDFGAGVKQIEWQCPELSKRFLYLAYGIAPYFANGSQVVWHYSGDLLDKVSNCEVGQAPQPDDVLSSGSTSTYGHTSVVVASDVDDDGNGEIRVIEQNNSSTGLSTLSVDNWCVAPTYGEVSGWLHNPAQDEWVVKYYSDAPLTTKCHDSRVDGTYVFGNWGAGAPADGCPSDHFSARFSRQVSFVGGDYTFALGYDDGAHLKIDGQTVIDGWETPGPHHDYETRHIERGRHDVEIEYYEKTGDAYLTAFWWGPGLEVARESRDSSRWYAQYWGNQALRGDAVVSVNGRTGFLDHNWGNDGPAVGLPVDHFSSRFEQGVDFDAGWWRFVVSADDGVRLWVDDDPILDEWQDQVATFSQEVELTKGTHEVKLEHYENLEVSHVRLSWERIPVSTTLTGGITSPIGSTAIVSCPLTIEAEIGDEGDSGVEVVEFHAAYDGAWHHLGDDPTPPYQAVWDCSSVGNQGVWLSIHVQEDGGDKVIDLGGHVYVILDVPKHVYLPFTARGH